MAPSLQVARYQADLRDPDVATAETVQVMGNLVDRSVQHPAVQRAAREALGLRGGPLCWVGKRNPQSVESRAAGAWYRVKQSLKFVHHDRLISAWFRETDQLQLLISPALLLWMEKPKGDCAIYTMMVCAFLRCYGIPYEIVTAAVTPGDLTFDHVWCRAVLPNGERLNLDASHGKYPGWQVPKEHRMRTQIWDEQGQPIEDAQPFRGLHDYSRWVDRPILPSMLALNPNLPDYGLQLARARGLGDTTVLDPSVYTDVPITNPQPVATGFNWGSLLSELAPQALNLVGKVVAPTTSIQSGPGGTSITTPAGAPVPTTAILSPFGGTGISSYLPWILLAGLGIVLFARRR